MNEKIPTIALVSVLIAGVTWMVVYLGRIESKLEEIRKVEEIQTQPHMSARTISIGNCSYLATEQPFTLTHRGDCTNHTTVNTNAHGR